MRSESRTVCSLMAIGPDVELSRPSLTESPSTQVSPDPLAVVPPLPVSVVVPLLHPANNSAVTATAPMAASADLDLPRLIVRISSHVVT
jgi:hypothetical protein